MRIKKAEKKELKEIAKLMLEEFSKPPFNEKAKINSILKSLKFYYKIGKIYIALINNIIISVIVFKLEQYWEGKVLIIEDLAVKQEFKGKGVGESLLNFVESYAKNNNVKRILFTTNKKSKSINFYRKRGYKEEKNRINFSKKVNKNGTSKRIF